MVKEAVEALGGRASHIDIINYIQDRYGSVKEGTIRCQITICTVNMPSRVNFPENKKPRKCYGKYDFLYSVNRGEVVLYNPSKHGEWEIANINGRFVVIKKSGSQNFPLLQEKQKRERVIPQTQERVYCPVCKTDVIIKNERSLRCPLCNNKVDELFENELRKFLLLSWKVSLPPRRVKIRGIMKKFDFVSDDMDFIGDAKFYKSLDVPAAKWSTIAEYVWLLQFTTATNKFLIFGRDKSIPQRWLNRYHSLIEDVKFYFFDHKKMELQSLT
ncbi:MAG: DUF7669 domain-containing protein [Candidatus Bathyarchaeia archaeon]